MKRISQKMLLTISLGFANCTDNEPAGFIARDVLSGNKVEITSQNMNSYVGKLIEIEGCVAWRFEEGAIYASRQDYENLNYKNSLWLSSTSVDGTKKEINDYYNQLANDRDEKTVVLSGYIDTSEHGHNGYYPGSFRYFNIRDGRIK